MNQRVTSLIPSQGTRLGCWPGLQLGARKKQLLQTQGGVNDILLPNGPTLVLRESPRPVLGSPCPPPRKRCLSMPEIGEKDRDYLFKELYTLKSNDLMSSLRSQSPLEYPQTHSPSVPFCPVRGTIPQKKKLKSVVLLCPSRMVPKRPRMAAMPGFKSQHQSSSAAPFPTPPTISHSCQHSHIFPALLGCPRESGQVWPCGVKPIISKLLGRLCNRGSCLLVTSWVEVTPILLAERMATAV